MPSRAEPTTVVSIHAPVWGATRITDVRVVDQNGFNPRARVGRDAHSHCWVSMPGCSFNPRARVGRDALETARTWRAG